MKKNGKNINNNNFNFRQKKISLDKMNYYNSYEDWAKISKELNFRKIKPRKAFHFKSQNTNSLSLNKAPRSFTKFHNNFFLTKTNSFNSIQFSTEKEENKKTYKDFKELQKVNAKIFKNALKSLRNLSNNKTQLNFFSNNDLDLTSSYNINSNKYFFSEIKNDCGIPKIKVTKNKLNQTSSLLSTKISQSHTIYFNSSLDNFYTKISNKKLKSESPLNKLLKKRNIIFSPNSYDINFINDIIKLYDEESKENKKNKDNINYEEFLTYNDNSTKLNKGISVKEKEQIDEDNILTTSGFNSYNQIILKNLFEKRNAKVKSGILDRIILDYNVQNNDILLNPFYNSYGGMLNDVYDKVKFIKGSLDLVYPRIIQKKYQIRAKQSIKKIAFLRSLSQQNFNKRNQNDIKNNLFSINKDKKISQSVFTKYPVYIKLKGKFSPNMYTIKGSERFNHKLDKQNFFMNKAE